MSKTKKGNDSFSEIKPALRPGSHSSALGSYYKPTLYIYHGADLSPFCSIERCDISLYKLPVNNTCFLGVLG